MSEVIVSELIQWIEGQLQLSEAIKVDAIAAKSGYSKWYLQREFKQKKDSLLLNMSGNVVYTKPQRYCAPVNCQLLISRLSMALALSRHLAVCLGLISKHLPPSFAIKDNILTSMR